MIYLLIMALIMQMLHIAENVNVCGKHKRSINRGTMVVNKSETGAWSSTRCVRMLGTIGFTKSTCEIANWKHLKKGACTPINKK